MRALSFNGADVTEIVAVERVDGLLLIYPREVTVTASDVNLPFAGVLQTVSTDGLDYDLPTGAALSGLASVGSGTFPDTMPIIVEGEPTITMGGVNVTANFDIVTVNGVLTVTPGQPPRVMT